MTLNLDRGLFRTSGKINLIIEDFGLIVESNVVLRQPVGFSFSKISQTKERWTNVDQLSIIFLKFLRKFSFSQLATEVFD